VPGYKYYRKLTKFEEETNNKIILQSMGTINRLKEERSELNAEIREEGKNIADAYQDLSTGQTEVVEDVYEVVDVGSGWMHVINADGLIIDKRFMKGGVQMNLSHVKDKDEKSA
jgi:predicted proteasome-type protease